MRHGSGGRNYAESSRHGGAGAGTSVREAGAACLARRARFTSHARWASRTAHTSTFYRSVQCADYTRAAHTTEGGTFAKGSAAKTCLLLAKRPGLQGILTRGCDGCAGRTRLCIDG